MSTPKRISREKRERQILETAKGLLLEKGFTVTVKEVAETIGVSEAYLYRFYPNKKVLFEALYIEHFATIGEMIHLGNAGPDSREQLIVYFTNFYRQSEKSKTLELLYLFALEKSENRPSMEVFRSVVPSLTDPLEEYIRSGIEGGYFRSVDPITAADFIHSAFFHFIYHYTIFIKIKLTDEELRKKIGDYVDLFLKGIID